MIPFENILQYTAAIFVGSNSRFNSGIATSNLLGNLLILLPFPIFLELLRYTSFGAIKNFFEKISGFKFVMLVTLVFDILILLSRFALTIQGIFDVDDIILNLLGAVAGYFLFNRVECIVFNNFGVTVKIE